MRSSRAQSTIAHTLVLVAGGEGQIASMTRSRSRESSME
jgi:hypothetical protein